MGGKSDLVKGALEFTAKLLSEGGEQDAKTGIRAYHGSPYDFDKFDMSKIGTGEGAQAYGHGLYFAGNEDVARGYRDTLSASPFRTAQSQDPNDIAAGALKLTRGNRAEAAQMLRDNLSDVDLGAGAEPVRAAASLLEGGGDIRPPGHMYEVNIAADPNTFLDWDKPLSEQPEVWNKISSLWGGPEEAASRLGIDPNVATGRQYLDAIAPQGRGEAFAGASRVMAENGIPGIKYLDAGSRGAGEGTRNYVVFDDKLISIIRKYGIAGASAMLGYNLMENLDPKQAQAATVADKEYQANQPEIRGGRLPAGMEPSGEMTSRIPSASDRIYDYVMSVLGGDEGTKAQRAQTVMNIIDQTPLAVGPVAYDIGRGVTEAVMRADGGAVREGYAGKGRVVGDIVEQALKLIAGGAKEAAPKAAIRAYHVSPHDFDVFKPSEFRGSTFFSSTPERAKRGAEAGRNEMGIELPPVNWRTYEVEIDPSRIKGLSLTPSESKWFEGLPERIVGDDALAEAINGIPGFMYWDDFYDVRPISEGVYEYTKKATAPSVSYEDAIKNDRSIYNRNFPHYNNLATDEKKAAENTAKQGMAGYLVHDEGGLSFAINDPSIVKILRKYAKGGSIREGYGPGGWVDDVVKMAGKVISGEGEEAAKTGIRAYHASPHDFDKFEWSPRTSRTGEGAQAYGAGLYFAESPAVSGRGGRYDKQFTRKLQEMDRTGELGEKMGRVKISGKPSIEYGIENDPGFIEAVKTGNVAKYARERLDRWHELSGDASYPYPEYAAEKTRAWEKLLNDYFAGADVYYPMRPRIYEVDINANPNQMLRWDEPLKNQPPDVLRGLGFLNPEDISALQKEKAQIEAKLREGGWNDPLETQDPDEFWSQVNDSVLKNSESYNALLKIDRELSKASSDIPDVTAGKFYKNSPEKPENISAALRDRGVPGIQFWDGNSRNDPYLSQWRADPSGKWTVNAFSSEANAKEYLKDVWRGNSWALNNENLARVIKNPSASSNYVIPDDRLISIVRKYGIAGASAMLGYNLMENLDPKQALAATMADKDYQAGAHQKADGGAVDPYAEEIASAKRILADKAYKEQSWSDWAGDAAENAVRTARSILPTALGGEGSVGISDIARGAYEGGKDAVMFPGDVITGKQALFDEAGRPLESAVGRSFNTAATVGGASSVVPRPANSVGVFGGISSKTADKPALREAMKMESKGASPDEIWDNTGWFRGADRRWRYEIPDIGTTVNSAALQLDLSVPTIQPVKSAKLGDYLQHPRFFEAYPQFKNMNVRTMPGSSSYGGMYYPRFSPSWGTVIDPYIELNENLLSSGLSQRSVLLHEIQHAIQNKEGFAPGTNIGAQSAGRTNPAVNRYQEAVKNDPEMRELMSIRSSMDYKKQVNEANDLYEAEYRPRDDEIDASSMSDIEKKAAYNAINKEYDERIKNMFPMIKQVEDLTRKINSKNIPLYMPTKKMLTPTEAYHQYAGETEARNVQSRMDWSEENLRGFRPWETQDFPYIDQLFPENDVTWKLGYSSGGEVDDDITDALRIAKQVGGVLMEDAKGNKYDAHGNLIPPTTPGPNPARTPTPQEVGQKASMDPATFDALMQQYAVPDRDIAQYKATKAAVAAQPREIQQMTHVGDRPTREVKVDMPLFGGEYSVGSAPYDVAGNMSGVAQTAYDLKTVPFYAIPLTAPIAAGMDVAEGVAMNDPLIASLAVGFGPGGKYAKAAGIGAVNYFMDPAEAEAGPARWFSKAVEAARNVPMNKMTGEQALAMLRKGVSPEELKWIGADRFLPGQESITKQDLIDYLEKNRVGTKDVVLGGNKPTRRADVEPTPTASAPYEEEWNRIKAESLGQIERARQAREMGDLAKSDAIKAAWITNQSRLQDLREKMVDATIEEMGGLGEPLRYGPGSGYGDKYVTRGGEDYRETLITLPRKEFGNLYQSGHWEGIPNVVGHIRTQVLDVTPPGSNRPYKAFNVDEAQSDYAKAGREKGFGIPKEEYNKLEMKALISREKLLQHYEGLPERHRPTNEEIQSDISRMINGRLPVYINPEGSAKPLVDSFMNDYKSLEKAANALPTAPYVTSTQNWTDLSIKKALDQAMDAGADYFTYTPGEAQAKRYNLRNDVEGLAYDPEEKRLSYYPKNKVGWQDVRETVEPNDIKKYIGEEAAKKLLSQEPNALSGNHILEGIDLEFGGEGMIDYYNNIYKKRVEKVVKDATGKKVQWEVIPVQTADGPREQLGFRITDMQDARFSDFNKGGRVTDRAKYADSDAVSRALALTSEV